MANDITKGEEVLEKYKGWGEKIDGWVTKAKEHITDEGKRENVKTIAETANRLIFTFSPFLGGLLAQLPNLLSDSATAELKTLVGGTDANLFGIQKIMAIAAYKQVDGVASALQTIYEEPELTNYLKEINSADLHEIFKIISTPPSQEISQLLHNIMTNAQKAIEKKSTIKSKADLIKQIFLGDDSKGTMKTNAEEIQKVLDVLDQVEALKTLKTPLSTTINGLITQLSGKSTQ